MLDMPTTAKITKKGQVTIPREIRKRLDTDVIEFAIQKDQTVLKPVKSVAGSLNSYASGKVDSYEEVRETAWEETAKEEHGKKTHRR
jgi:AbrB family looped-hinge helix DNA binding protein